MALIIIFQKTFSPNSLVFLPQIISNLLHIQKQHKISEVKQLRWRQTKTPALQGWCGVAVSAHGNWLWLLSVRTGHRLRDYTVRNMAAIFLTPRSSSSC